MASKANPPATAAPADLIQVERLGGFAGFGQPGAALRSHGTLRLAQLSPQAQATLAAWFDHPPPAPTVGNDDFTYRLTRQGPAGAQVVELPAALVPALLRSVGAWGVGAAAAAGRSLSSPSPPR